MGTITKCRTGKTHFCNRGCRLHTLNYPNEVLESFLYLGNKWHAADAELCDAMGITHIISACVQDPREHLVIHPHLSYLHIEVSDRHSSPLESHFSRAYDFFRDVEAKKGKVDSLCARDQSKCHPCHCVLGASVFGLPRLCVQFYSIPPLLDLPQSGFHDSIDCVGIAIV